MRATGTSELLLASANPGKLAEFSEILGDRFRLRLPAEILPDWEAPEEDGATYAENARIKAEDLASRTRLPTLGDDSGLEVEALGGRPGLHSARYAPTAPERIERLLAELSGLPESSRRARFVCVLCLCRPGSPPRWFEGELRGTILDAPRGRGGFGYDPLFLPEGLTLSIAELPASEKHRISHRGRALARMVESLASEVLS